MISRRSFVRSAALSVGAAVLPGALAAAGLPALPAQLPTSFGLLPEKLASLEAGTGGRLGVAVLDTATGLTVGHRTGERFAMCSSCKVLLASCVSAQVDAGQQQWDRLLPVPPRPLVSHSPLTEPHAGGSMTVRELCHAILTQSDNTATNILLASLGGPAAVTRFARSLGDPVTRLDRTETALNEATPGDPRDTTSPAAAAADLQRLLLGEVLQPASRAQLKAWMVENQYGLDRLRANLPAGWVAADKTGSNGETTGADIAVYWPLHRAPVIVTAYITECPGTDAHRGKILAAVGSLVVAAVQAA